MCLRILLSLNIICWIHLSKAQIFEIELEDTVDAVGFHVAEYDEYFYVISEHQQLPSDFKEKYSVIWKINKQGVVMDSLSFNLDSAWNRLIQIYPTTYGLFVYGVSFRKNDKSGDGVYYLLDEDLNIDYKVTFGQPQSDEFIHFINTWSADTMVGIFNENVGMIDIASGNYTIFNGHAGHNHVVVGLPVYNQIITYNTSGLPNAFRVFQYPFNVCQDSSDHYPYLIFLKHPSPLNDSTFMISSFFIPETESQTDLSIYLVGKDINFADSIFLDGGDHWDRRPSLLDALSVNDSTGVVYFGGTYRFDLDYFYPERSRFELNRLDVALNHIWNKRYRADDKSDIKYVQYSTLATSDGGCIMVGSKWDYSIAGNYKRHIYILKVDSTGIFNVGTAEETEIQPELKIFPNPCTENYCVVTTSQEQVGETLSLYDLAGRQIIYQVITSPRTSLDLTGLAPGVYLVHVNGTGGKKLIVR